MTSSEKYPLLFSPFELGALVLPNRIVMAPMSSSLADTDGRVTRELVGFMEARARGGTGLVIVEFSCVDGRYGLGEARQPRIDRDGDIDGHAWLAGTIKAAGARVCLQLHLPGQYVVQGTCVEPLPVAPSDVFARDGRQIARALRGDEIERLVERYAEAARRAVRAGYEAIEVHGAHGYLPMAFLSPRKNHRDDAWGGDFDRRMAFPLAIVRALRAELGSARPLVYRLSAAEFVEAGLSIDDMERVVPRLVEAGCDALHVSTGVIEGALDKIVDPMSSREGWRFGMGRRIREAAGVPVIAVGPVRWPATAEKALATGDADLIALGRPLLADPEWAIKARHDRLPDITPCTNCNWCMDRVRHHLSIGCAERPRTGHETDEEWQDYDRRSGARKGTGPAPVAAVVGAGPGGLYAALHFDAIGYTTHLFEAQREIGGGLVTSAAPPHKEPLRWYLDHLRHRLATSGMTVHLGTRATAAQLLALQPSAVIIATGSRGRAMPLPQASNAIVVHEATDILVSPERLAGVPGPVIVYGGGETGCEAAEFLAARGIDVKLVTRSAPHELARAAEPMYRRQLRARLASNRRIEIIAHATIEGVEPDGVTLHVGTLPPRFVPAGAVIMAQGREPANDLVALLRREGIPCAAIGDAHAIGRIGDAVHGAHAAIRALDIGARCEPGGRGFEFHPIRQTD